MKTKKLLSLFLAVLMAFSALSVCAFAADRVTPAEYVAGYKKVDTSRSSTTAADLPDIIDSVLSYLGKGKLNTAVNDIFNKKLSNQALADLLAKMQSTTSDDAALYAEFSPAGIRSGLVSDQSAAAAASKAIAKLNTGIAAGNDWANVPAFESGDFGFEDGDVDGFFLALARCLLVLKVNGNDSILGFYWTAQDATNGYINTYDYLVKLYGILGLEAISTADFLAAHNGDLVTAVTTAFAPLANLLKTIKKSPLDTMLGVLPATAYLIRTGELNSTMSDLYKTPKYMNGVLADKDPELTTAAVYAAIKDFEIAGTTFGALISERDFGYLLEDIEHSGSAAVGHDANGKEIVVITADKNTVAVTIGNALFGMLDNAELKEVINSLLASQGLNEDVRGVINALLRVVPLLGTETFVRIAKLATRLLSAFSLVRRFYEKFSKLKVFNR